MEEKNFIDWDKIHTKNILLTDFYTIDDKINILQNYLNWRYQNLDYQYNLDMYPFLNILIVLLDIKKNRSTLNVEEYLNFFFDFKKNIDMISNSHILSFLTFSKFLSTITKT